MIDVAQAIKVRGINYVQLWSNTLELTTDNGEISIELSKDNMEEIYKKLAEKLGKQVEEV